LLARLDARRRSLDAHVARIGAELAAKRKPAQPQAD
jgi:hypothetical protein